ncbi:glutamate--tRNA ligase [Melittangium boletus]|uniref:Glutamate--tRNA ligase n=1 Tax=Melittangium boletus DSM 14713 TaxID=1294270 RepID=A0A250I7G7_9BACT|nr:glutamate--tRNA ligase [Melittangium boletus]ATB27111.1 glutamate--tRNA ligase [Melittangium boletus DSM 14713]
MASAPRVRFAPSPTGYLHIGGARTALFNYLYAKRNGGVFILRIEDTDQERSTPESVKAILDGLTWLGIDWDEGPGKEGSAAPYFQTQRLDLYKKYAEQLIAEGKAYRCYCTREEIDARRAAVEKATGKPGTYKYEGTCRDLKEAPPGRTAVIRFKMPSQEGEVTFDDKALGPITKAYSDLDDWVMLRADGIPLYNYGCVIDDHTMDITLVGRGQEHVNSTFPQLMLYQALGWKPPEFAHFPLILGPDREKLSKRKHPEADVMLHKRNGILPEALLNFVVRLGWSHGNDEVISREQMIEWFDFDHVGTTSGVWNPEKLQWLNQQWLKLLAPAVVAATLADFLVAKGVQIKSGDPRLERVVLAFRERAKTQQEMADMALKYFQHGVTLEEKAAAKHLTAESKPLLTQVREQAAALPEWSAASLDEVVKKVSEQAAVGMGKVAQPVRVAVTGGTVSPGIGETLELLGREETLHRLDAALARP